MTLRRFLRLGIAMVFMLALAFALLIAFIPQVRWLTLGFGARDYPRLFAAGGWSRYGLPACVPQNATGIRIYAPASLPSLLLAPDQYVEIRFVLPPVDAATLLAQAQKIQTKSAFPASLGSFDHLVGQLKTADSPASPSVTSCLIANPSGGNIGGVTVNPTSGEVVYWIFEQ